MTKRSERAVEPSSAAGPRARRGGDTNPRGVLSGLAGFIELLSNLAENGDASRSGTLSSDDNRVKAVYGFSVRLGKPGTPRAEPGGDVEAGASRVAIEGEREPIVDVLDEEALVLVVAELPGVEAKDVRFEVREDILDLSATSRDHRYRAEILLPGAVDAEHATWRCHQGVFELKLPKPRT